AQHRQQLLGHEAAEVGVARVLGHPDNRVGLCMQATANGRTWPPALSRVNSAGPPRPCSTSSPSSSTTSGSAPDAGAGGDQYVTRRSLPSTSERTVISRLDPWSARPSSHGDGRKPGSA